MDKETLLINVSINQASIFFLIFTISKGKLKAPENPNSVDEDDIVCKQRTGVRSQAREATISPPPVWSDHLIHHQKRQSQLRSNWPSMPR